MPTISLTISATTAQRILAAYRLLNPDDTIDVAYVKADLRQHLAEVLKRAERAAIVGAARVTFEGNINQDVGTIT